MLFKNASVWQIERRMRPLQPSLGVSHPCKEAPLSPQRYKIAGRWQRTDGKLQFYAACGGGNFFLHQSTWFQCFMKKEQSASSLLSQLTLPPAFNSWPPMTTRLVLKYKVHVSHIEQDLLAMLKHGIYFRRISHASPSRPDHLLQPPSEVEAEPQ